MGWLRGLLSAPKNLEIKAADRAFVSMPVVSSSSRTGKKLQVDFPSITKWAYRGNELVHACTDERSRAFKEAHLKIYKETDQTIVEKHPIELLMRRPNPFRTQGDLLELIEQHLTLAGNAFIRKIRDRTGEVKELWPMQPHLITINPHPMKYIDSYTYTVDGKPYELAPEDVIHILYIDPEDDYYGLSPLVAAAKRIDADSELGSFLKQVLLNMAVTSGVFTTDKKLNKEDRRILEGTIANNYIGSVRAGLPMLLGGGFQWQQTSMNLKELEVGNVQSILETRICMSLHVPAILVGAKAGLERSTFSNVKEARAYLYENAIGPEWAMTSEKIGLSLLKDFNDGDEGLVPRFDTSHIKALQDSEDAKYKRMDTADYLSDVEKRLYTGNKEKPNGTVFKNISMVGVDITQKPQKGPIVPPTLKKETDEDDKNKKKNKTPEIKSYDTDHIKKLKARMGSLQDEHLVMFTAAAKRVFEDTSAEFLLYFDQNFTGEALSLEPLTSRLESITKRGFQTNLHQLFKASAEDMEKFIEDQTHPTTKAGIPNRASKFAAKYAGDLAKGLTATSKKQLKKVISEGVKKGNSIPVIRMKLEETMSDWPVGRADLVAETETVRAANAGILDSIKLKGHGFKQWITLPGACDICLQYEDQIFPVDALIDDVALAPPLHPRCVIGDTEIISPDIKNVIRTKYSGKVIKFSLADGTNLTVTPNHVLLTSSGWKVAKFITKSDNIISSTISKRISSSNPNKYNRPATIKEIFSSTTVPSGSTSTRVPVAPEYLHGDGRFCNGNIDIKPTDSLLRDTNKAPLNEHVEHNKLTRIKNSLSFNGKSDFMAKLIRLGLATSGNMSSSDVSFIFNRTTSIHHKTISASIISAYDFRTQEASSNNISTNVESISDTLLGFSGDVFSNNIVDIKFKHFHGFVYDLSSFSTLYTANGVISSNCRCILADAHDPADTDEGVEATDEQALANEAIDATENIDDLMKLAKEKWDWIDWSKNFNGSTDVVNLDNAKATVKQWNVLANKYPKVANDIEALSFGSPLEDDGIDAIATSVRAHDNSFYGRFKSRIHFNSDYYQRKGLDVYVKDNSLESVAGQKDKVFGMARDTKDVMTHEFGHHVRHYGNKNKIFEGINKVLNDLWHEWGTISEYAKYSEGEAFAEIFTSIETGANSNNPLVQAVKKWLEKNV